VVATSLAVVVPKETFISALAAKGVTASLISYEVEAAVTLGGLAGSAADYSGDPSCIPCVVKRFQLRHGAATAAGVDISAVEITSALDGRRRQLQERRRLAVAVGVSITSEDHSISDAMGDGFVESLRNAAAAIPASEIAAVTGVTAETAAASIVDTASVALTAPASFTTTVTYAFQANEAVEGAASLATPPAPALISEALGSLGVSVPTSSISTVARRDCGGSWGGWGPCSAVCAGGRQTRSYTVVTTAAIGGVACPADEARDCNSDPSGPAQGV
jgi:hypothetical protein